MEQKIRLFLRYSIDRLYIYMNYEGSLLIKLVVLDSEALNAKSEIDNCRMVDLANCYVESGGFAPSHSREIADKVAAAGYYTVLPDFFRGDPYQHGAPLTPWLKKHAPEEGIKDAIPIIEALKGRGITKIGVAGFCWGGKVAADLSKYPYVEATVLLHPTYTTTEDIQGDKVPISILGGEKDTYCKPELVKEFENILKSKPEVDSFVKIVPGVDHGWTLRYNSSEFALKKAAESHNDMLDWFEMHLRY
ncbi:PREDICTED: endo-1,3;1,4-beta-D-glucanase-like isoform X3 [Erythranthe guttata]|uniref:endo-1,3;1,4-beta-D-glucanase-like isoform X3 n=2 Tax=Erythranthe guttata TaxID=4155 RepID=UPI00064DF85A|nr:PREDICTED: endo-1,3;1,4-beta-D-glucanase-like isoform X3 [Erythranthe guttata]|eukprot:XP_012841221.1 PREDICTED: endo-1,3;1,4-beta-D-glucanase-like isoform X3 [Erythranthe guttata]